MSLWKETCEHNHGFISLATPVGLNISVVDQYYKIPGVFAVFDHANFTANSTGKLTHVDVKGSYTLNGTSDVAVSKACVLTYALFKNGSLVPGAESPHTFVSSNRIGTLSIAAIIHLIKGDYLEVYVKSDVAVVVSPSTLHVTLYGARH